MVRFLLPILLLSVLSTFGLCGFPIASICPYHIKKETQGGPRIPMAKFGIPSSPWFKPFPGEADEVGNCISWNAAAGRGLKFRQKRICDYVTVHKTSKYAIKLSTFCDDKHIRNTHLRHIHTNKPDAVIHIHGDEGFTQRLRYRGHAFQTKDILKKGRRYKICVAGRRKDFTVCAMNFVACSSYNVSKCQFSKEGQGHYSSRKC